MGQPDVRKGSGKPERHTALHGSRSSRSSGGRANRLNYCSWFDVRVFYVRLMKCFVPEAPGSLTMCFPSRRIDVVLEINGGRVAPSEAKSVLLRRDRLDPELEEVTFVSTDNLRVCGGSLSFDIYKEEVLLLVGGLKQEQLPVPSFEGVFPRASEVSWRLEVVSCLCSSSSGSRGALRPLSLVGTSMEVYVVGRYAGTPVILTQTVHLSSSHHRKSHGRLDAIPEDEEEECSSSSMIRSSSNNSDVGQDMDDDGGAGGGHGSFKDDKNNDEEEESSSSSASPSMLPAPSSFDKLYRDSHDGEAGDEGEEGEIMSWFNAGVRVGVGIGLGMCLGVGIGVGLLVRTYNATAKSLRRTGMSSCFFCSDFSNTRPL